MNKRDWLGLQDIFQYRLIKDMNKDEKMILRAWLIY